MFDESALVTGYLLVGRLKMTLVEIFLDKEEPGVHFCGFNPALVVLSSAYVKLRRLIILLNRPEVTDLVLGSAFHEATVPP